MLLMETYTYNRKGESMSEAKKTRKTKELNAGELTNKLFEIMDAAHKEYYAANDVLKKYAGRVLNGEDLKSAREAAIAIETIYRERMDPIFKFISTHHPYASQTAYQHYDFLQQNKQANDPAQAKIFDPNTR